MRLDGAAVLEAGALSSSPDAAMASARELGIARPYPGWREMLAGELALPVGVRMEAVSIVTPNDTHAMIAGACLAAGFDVVVDKPLATSSADCDRLAAAARSAGRSLTVTYNYSGYPLVREARAIVAGGGIGPVRRVAVEYHQGWLATRLEAGGHKQASWRTDPGRTGGVGALGDIGTHAEHLAAFVTGASPIELCAEVRTVVEGRGVDDDASVLLRYPGGSTGTLTCSQVCVGEENGLSIRVYGRTGSLAWRQEQPNRLEFRTAEGLRVLTRGSPGLSSDAADATRLPPGHPEGFHEAFATIYRGACDRVRGIESRLAHLAPTAEDGARGLRFIEACTASKGSWVRLG
jgi:predicted dehydrogenase